MLPRVTWNCWACYITLLALASVNVLHAQQGTGRIVGTVRDSSGAVVPGAAIEITNLATGVVYHTTTNSSGSYESPAVVLGTYRISAALAGFKTAIANDVTVDVDQRAQVDLSLTVGQVSESVEVSTTPPTLDSTSATIGTVLEAKPVHELPLNGRNALALVTLTPGVRNNVGATQEGFADRGTNLSATSINGSPTASNGYILDGQNNILGTYTGEVAINPTVDAIEEFKVQSGVMSAEYGFTAGGVVNLVSRSGTDKYHGTIYEFLRNDALNAANALTPAGQSKPELRYNQYGAALGGPIVHQKAFFFGNWEESRYLAGSPQYMTVPTVQERGGDFSDLYGTNGVLIPIYDPAKTVPNPNGSGYIRSAFPGNVIPTYRLDPVALNIQSNFYPLPNITPTNALTHANNFAFEPKTITNRRDALGRVDYKVGDKDNLFVRYAYHDNQTNNGQASATTSPSLYPSPIPANRYDNFLVQSATIGYAHTFSTTLFNDIRVSMMRVDFPFTAASFGGGWPQKLGLPSSVPSDTIPVVNNGLPIFTGSAGFRAYTNPQITDTLTKILGAHSITAGFDIRENIGTNYQRTYPSGNFSFAQTLTGNPQSQAGTGSTYATFLLGAVSSANVTLSGEEQDRSFAGAFFIQDDWKATSRFIINAGLRYEYQQQPYEQHNGYSNFNPSAKNPLNGLLGEVEFAATGGNGRNFVSENYRDFSPRIGFAYTLPFKFPSVLRGGYAIYHPMTFNTLYNGITAGFTSTTTTYNPTGGNTNLTAFQFSNGFPTPPVAPLGAALGPSAFLGNGVSFVESSWPTPMSQQYELSFQQQLPSSIVAEIAYSANRGTHFPAGSYNINQLNPSYFSLGNSLLNPVPNPYAGIVPGSLGAATITLQQSLLPFPYYSSVTDTYPHTGSFDANYLEISAQKQSDAFTLLFGYTMGKLLDDSIASPIGYLTAATNLNSYQNIYNREAEYSLDPTDVSQRATVSTLYNLPFGAHTRFHSANGFINGLIGGYQVNLIGAFQTGFPLAISGANNYVATRPNYVPGVSVSVPHPTRQQWFNTAAFVNPPNWTFGDVSRTLPHVRAPGTENVDMSLFKTTPIHDNLALQLRVEAFNVLNHVNLGAPNTTFSPGSNGLNANGAFGTVTTAADARSIQLAAKIIF